MELADRILESAEDMTAAETAPSPMNATAVGVKYCSTRGRIIDLSTTSVSLLALSYSAVCFQSTNTIVAVSTVHSYTDFKIFNRNLIVVRKCIEPNNYRRREEKEIFAVKILRLQGDSNPWPPRYRCDALPTEL